MIGLTSFNDSSTSKEIPLDSISRLGTASWLWRNDLDACANVPGESKSALSGKISISLANTVFNCISFPN